MFGRDVRLVERLGALGRNAFLECLDLLFVASQDGIDIVDPSAETGGREQVCRRQRRSIHLLSKHGHRQLFRARRGQQPEHIREQIVVYPPCGLRRTRWRGSLQKRQDFILDGNVIARTRCPIERSDEFGKFAVIWVSQEVSQAIPRILGDRARAATAGQEVMDIRDPCRALRVCQLP